MFACSFLLVSACAGGDDKNEGAEKGEGEGEDPEPVVVDEYLEVKLDTLGGDPTRFDGQISASKVGRVWTITASNGPDATLTIVHDLDNPNGTACGNGTSLAYADGEDSYSTLFGIGGTCSVRVEDEANQVSGTFAGSLINQAGNRQFNLASGFYRAAIDQ